jgi:hypothetical protein
MPPWSKRTVPGEGVQHLTDTAWRWVHGPTGYAPWPLHGCCMGEQQLVRSWCEMRGEGCAAAP